MANTNFIDVEGLNIFKEEYVDIQLSNKVDENDSRLSDARPASDVQDWAKAREKPTYTASEVGALASNIKGAVNGVAELGADGKVPANQLPAYVDDIIELLDITSTAPSTCANGDLYYNTTSKKIFEATAIDTWSDTGVTPESGKIYTDLKNNKTYRWGGNDMVEISESLAIGETQGTAYDGKKGKDLADKVDTITTATAEQIRALWNTSN